ncbi:MAG: YcnI family protein [Acidobacteria bacterium]|nr:YcnI family protein [Acidobacteriota bacterium]
MDGGNLGTEKVHPWKAFSVKFPARTALKTTLISGTTIGLMTLGLAAASAHVEATPDTSAANSYALVTFNIPHGCNDSPTTKMTINLPQEITTVMPTVNPNWTISETTEKLATPQKLPNGSEVTERTSQIIYTAKTPLDPHQRDTFVLSVQLPDAAGKTIYFPTLQTCTVGQTDWKDIPAAGANEDSVKSPAPSVKITAADSTTSSHDSHAADTSSASEASQHDGGSQVPGWIGFAAGIVGLILGSVALVRTRKKPSSN